MFALAVVWHSYTGAPTLPSWAMAGAYVVGAFFCARAGLVMRQAQQADRLNPWWVLAILLLFLGINKLIALQTLLVKLGRTASWLGGWYQHRRAVQAVFVGLFTLVVLGTLAGCSKKWKWFIKKQPLVLAGILFLSLFVVVRASNFHHIQKLLHLNLHDDHWGWILELGGIACLAWPSTQIKAR